MANPKHVPVWTKALKQPEAASAICKYVALELQKKFKAIENLHAVYATETEMTQESVLVKEQFGTINDFAWQG